ncbi:2-aminobenzoate-CoA ligase [Comamonas testosteroni TK102]|jgi:2-aminobenzoate-CoA ligase|uniref:2-aminobenzoate-CoA ligase n=1 Tax=Comamonas testosteroni TK102 TaxID=1392005 RepID=A0A076PLS2_COMTE|nr:MULTISPECIES: benzoate-CoA ligase family protein [Comamonas]AIJ44595.1 2-aminobenzoate-CoA ligase [Comamonas testosteroni TK102]MPS88010.1 benzoate-CoA ligase family protein [Comamonas sp.]TYK71786.1 benzoate-CoA ligase family protein [Comamonas sp. Z3]
MSYTAHIDTFAADNLPPAELQPEFRFELPELQFPERLNCAVELLDRHVAQGRGDRLCIQAEGVRWTYAELQEQANRVANVLTGPLGLVTGNRVLLCAPNNPMMVACWFGVIKAGGIAVAAMPLLRAKELSAIVDIAQIGHALCDEALRSEMQGAQGKSARLQKVLFFNGQGAAADALEPLMQAASASFTAVDTAATDTCLLGFTSGTTGVPKATMHFHRDVMAVCACWPAHVLRANADDVFIGSPPLAFTFGLGGQVLFPMSIAASMALLEKAGPAQLVDGIEKFGATVVFTAPTSYRVMAQQGERIRRTRLRKCVSAGEALTASTRALWKDATGIEIIDGIGSTEMLHIFISHREEDARPGATGKAVPGYRAKVVDEEGREVSPGTVGKLAVQGPTGCRYLNDSRQTKYVSQGWNLTGDAYLMDGDGYFVYQARTDDMIISSGYNIASPEVEEALLLHAAVAECAVIGVADSERGQIVKAFVVLRAGHMASDALVMELQDFVKSQVAPYKYPRAVQFVDQLPRTATGKLQRFRLHET